MDEKRPTPETPAGKAARRNKRVAPTIDLTAKDVTASEIPVTETPQTPVEPPVEPVVTSEADPPPPPADPIAASNAPIDVPPPEAVSNDPQPTPEAEAKPYAEAASPPPFDEAPKPARAGMAVPLLAGLAGAAAMSAVLFGLWLTGLVPIRYAGSTALRAQVAGLEMKLQDLQNRPAAAVTDTKAIDALTQRLAKAEELLTKLPAVDTSLPDRVVAVDNAMKSLSVALVALNKRSDDASANSTQARERSEAAEKAVADLRASVQDVSKTANAGASSADLAPLQQRIAALEQAAKTANADIAKATASDASARLALSAASLRDAVLRGGAYGAELTQAKALGADDKVLASLNAYAATGIPSDKALAAELSAILPGMIKAAAPAASGGFMERLQANATQLVRVRPVDAPVGDEPAAVLARLEGDAARADIAAALADLAKLPEAQRAPAQAWIVKAQSRQSALASARQLAADTARSLGSK